LVKISEEEQSLWIAIRTTLDSVATSTVLRHTNAIYRKQFMAEH